MKPLSRMLLIMLMFYAIPRLAYGDDAEIAELKNRIEYLEKKVEIMNQTLTRVMGILDSSSSVSKSQKTIAPNPLKWKDKQNWRRLRSGMGKDEVRSLLGEPDRIVNLGSSEVWSYGEYGDGVVRFSPKERIEAWIEP